MSKHREKSVDDLLSQLKTYEDLEKKQWWERYIKHDSLFLGIPMDKLRKILKDWYNPSLSNKEHLKRIEDLFKGDYEEEKLMGILYLKEVESLKDEEVLTLLEVLFEEHYIMDWHITDWLAVKVLKEMAEKRDQAFFQRMLAWGKEDNLWKARASMVTYAQAKVLEEIYPQLAVPLSILIKRPERFAKTAVGWVLREIEAYDETFVMSFLKDHCSYLSTEVIRNSLKNRTKDEQRLLKEYCKDRAQAYESSV